MITIVYKDGSDLAINLDSQVASDYLLSTIDCDRDKIETITETKPQTPTTSPRKSKIMFIKVTEMQGKKESKNLINLDHVIGFSEIIDEASIKNGRRTEIVTIRGVLEVKEPITLIQSRIQSLIRG